MGLAKYKEDIEERWLANNEPPSTTNPLPFFRTTPNAQFDSHDVFLLNGNRRIEDFEVLSAGSTVTLRLNQSPSETDVVIRKRGGNRLETIIPDANHSFPISSDSATNFHLSLVSGGYVRDYQLSFVTVPQLEFQTDFAELIHALGENPPSWTDRSFELFRYDLDQVLAQRELPERLVQGIIEYHISLFQEDRNVANYRSRLETAYGLLRPFHQVCDLARLICAFYLFRANEFSSAHRSSKEIYSRLDQAIEIFRRTTLEDRSKSDYPERQPLGCSLPLLIPAADALFVESVDTFLNSKIDSALQLLRCARRESTPTKEVERTERMNFLEARIWHTKGTRNRFEPLLNELTESPSAEIAAAAKTFLETDDTSE